MKQTRFATVNDAASMLEIYRPYVQETPISFETECPSNEEFQRRVLERSGKYPWLVCEVDGEIVGYAYAGAFHARRAYQWSVESTVYIKEGCHRRGIGRDLYENLFQILKGQGVVNVIGIITLPNEGSQKLHEHFGFVQAALYKDIGFKFDKWWDVGYWQLQLQKPQHPGPLRELVTT